MANEKENHEWKNQKKWNPYNSFKLLVHVERWMHIARANPLPPPVLITVDPANICNCNCVWCNAEYIRRHRNFMLSETTLMRLAEYLPRWGHTGTYKAGVQAVCVAGGGEPLLNCATPAFIDACTQRGIEVGVVTNGTCMHNAFDALSKCTWVGVSVDAGSEATFNALKGLSPGKKTFATVIDNIANLVEYSKSHKSQLGKKHPSYGVSYKYLLHKENISDVYRAAKLAKEIGCKSIHFRPAGTTWDKIGTAAEIVFSQDDIDFFQEQIQKAQELDDESFGVYAVTHKFNSQFGIANCFTHCYALFMTAVIAPRNSSTSSEDAFTMSLCCDRRGDPKLELLSDCEDIDAIEKAWGSDEHWAIHSCIDVASECPRCTYQPHNQIYEEVIVNDSMTYKFI